MKNKTPKVPPAKKTGKTEKKDFPGYPLYPPSDDITDRAKQVPADLEDPSLQENSSIGNVPRTANMAMQQDDEGQAVEPENEFDVTPEDLEALGPKDLTKIDPAHMTGKKTFDILAIPLEKAGNVSPLS